jgi:hypothetical protein
LRRAVGTKSQMNNATIKIKVISKANILFSPPFLDVMSILVILPFIITIPYINAKFKKHYADHHEEEDDTAQKRVYKHSTHERD